MADFDPARAKSQLRLTAQKLGQMQDKMESQAQITRRDIATLLQQGNTALARAKAQKLMGEDVLSDLLQTLEMHVGVILGSLGELDRSESTPSPIVVEAAASIITAAPQIESKELRSVRDMLIGRLGHDFVRSVNDYVSSRVRGALSTRPPSAAKLDQYMFSIAKSNGVQWTPDLHPHEKVNIISEMLDASGIPVVDETRLRKLCSQGLPENPPWLRPKVWRLLLGTLPTNKTSWAEESRKSRDNYYDLVRRLLDPFAILPTPTNPPTQLDASLMEVSQELSRVPPRLTAALQESPEVSPLCPFEETASEDIRIACAHNLDLRLRLIRDLAKGSNSADSTPEIRLEGTPEVHLDASENSSDEENEDLQAVSSGRTASSSILGKPSTTLSGISTTLLPSRSMGVHQKHASALLRLLYIHSCLNPANQSPHIASLLVPIYSAMTEEVVPEDVAHVEADTFWLFEAFVSEFTELNDVEGSNIWIRRFSERLNWADPELADDLQNKGLDPALPHYSFRWLVPLLTHTLPLPSVMTIWDALLSRPMRNRDTNYKLEYLIDVCTSMLLRTKGVLLRLGRPGHKIPDLWADEIAAIRSTPLGVRELEDAFSEGMTFLQQYQVEVAGGIEAILQTAHDLFTRREAELNTAKNASAGLGARLRDTVWKGFAAQPSIVESILEDDETDQSLSEDEAEIQPLSSDKKSTLTSRLADTVWRGISNESAMDAPPSPTTPLSPYPTTPEPVSKELPEVPVEDAPRTGASTLGRSTLWSYAEKLKESDAAATLAKVSTNWRVKALDAWNNRSSGTYPTYLSPPQTSRPSSFNLETRRVSLVEESTQKVANDKRRGGSLPGIDRSEFYTPPARPAFFKPPRDSVLLDGHRSPLSPNREMSPASDTGSAGAKTSPGSFAVLEKTKPVGKSGPRPLLLNSASLITSGHSRSPTITPTSSASDKAWADSVRGKQPPPVQRDSVSSKSSVSPSDVRVRSRAGTRSELESDTTSSRIVPLRSSRSPMASGSRRVTPTSSVASSPPRHHRRMDTETSTQFGSDDGQSAKGWDRGNAPDSPTTGPSPPPPQTPDAFSAVNAEVRVKGPEARKGSLALSESNDTEHDKPIREVHEVKLSRRAHHLPHLSLGQTSEDSATTQAPSRSPRLKSKRVPPRLGSMRTRDNSKSENGVSNQKTLAPDWSEELDNATTPRAISFETSPFPTSPSSPRATRRIRKTSGEGNGEVRARKVSGEGREARTRKVSADGHSTRIRKISGERDAPKHKRDSSAVEGDDEGYNDLLSAYESEDAI